MNGNPAASAGGEGARTLRLAALFVTYMQSASLPLPNALLRFIQGAASGVLAPLSMAIAMETLPPAQRGTFGPRWTAIVLLSTMALTSPMLDELLGFPPDTTGYLTIPRGVGLVGAFLLMGRVPERLDRRPFVAGSIAMVIYANWLMLGYSPLMDGWPVALAGALQGAGLGVLMPALSKVAFSTLDPKLRPEGTGFFNLARVYGSTLGVAVVQACFFNNTQAMHQALASHLTAYRMAASTSLPALGALNEMITGQAAFIAIVDQFKILLWVLLLVSPLVVFLRKPVPTN